MPSRECSFVALADLGWERLVPDSSLRQLLLLACCNVVVALSLNVINGMAGQFSIGHAGFLALGAYSAAIVASHLHVALGGGEPTFLRSLLVVPAALVVAAVVAGVFGLLVGLPSLRLKGDYLAIVTLGFAEIVRLVIATAQIGGAPETIAQAWSHVGTSRTDTWGRSRTCSASAVGKLGGVNGYAGPKEAGVPLYAGPFWIVGMAALLFLVAWRLKWSGWGRALRALREDEIAAAAVGIDPTRYKVTSFVLSAIGGGLAGAMIALCRDGSPIVQPDSFGFAASFDAVTMVILGGSGSITGAALGAVLVTVTVKAIELLQHTAAVDALGAHFASLDLNALRMMIYAAILIALMIKRPEGLLGEREPWGNRGTTRGKRTGEGAQRATRERGEQLMDLVLRDVRKAFGGLRAVSDVSLTVRARSIFGLIGPNGAGKTTVFNLVTGVYPCDAGSIRFGETDLTRLAPASIAAAGVARTFQNVRLFAQLTLLENLLVACEVHKRAGLLAAVLRTKAHFADEDAMRARATELLTVFKLDALASRPAASLSYGDQRRLEIARAMMIEPKLLLLDEPAAGMNSREAEGLMEQIRWLRETFGVAVVLVEHNMRVVMGVCEEIHVLDHGETIAHGSPAHIRTDPRVLAAYLGEDQEGQDELGQRGESA